MTLNFMWFGNYLENSNVVWVYFIFLWFIVIRIRIYLNCFLCIILVSISKFTSLFGWSENLKKEKINFTLMDLVNVEFWAHQFVFLTLYFFVLRYSEKGVYNNYVLIFQFFILDSDWLVGEKANGKKKIITLKLIFLVYLGKGLVRHIMGPFSLGFIEHIFFLLFW